MDPIFIRTVASEIARAGSLEDQRTVLLHAIAKVHEEEPDVGERLLVAVRASVAVREVTRESPDTEDEVPVETE